MHAAPEVIRHATAEDVAHAVAARLVTRLTDLQAAGLAPSVALTGGTIANASYHALAGSPARSGVDWSRVEFWWGDERFVRAGDVKQRNAAQAREALLDRVPVSASRVHEMPASDGPYGDDVDAAAAWYAEELRRATPAEEGGDTPVFDILLLGIGEDGHCASLMPGSAALHDERPVVAVRDSPKPPPTRISLTMGPLMRSRELWWIASGAAKATPVRRALAGADVTEVPAAGPKGVERTLWLLDEAAAAEL